MIALSEIMAPTVVSRIFPVREGGDRKFVLHLAHRGPSRHCGDRIRVHGTRPSEREWAFAQARLAEGAPVALMFTALAHAAATLLDLLDAQDAARNIPQAPR